MVPLISVIIPVYNVEKYINKSINSIINQTYENIEIIIVDDGSTDDSGKICDDYKCKDNRIEVIHKENGGQGSARNMALDIAKGDYICFLDSDDSVYDDYVCFLYNQLVDNSLDISACNYELYDESDNFIRKRVSGKGYIELNGIEAIESMWTQGVINIGPWAKLYKKSLWDGVRFKECFAEDWATMHLIFEKAAKVGYSYDCKLKYLVRNNSSIRAFKANKLDMLKIADDNIKFANKYPFLTSAAKQKAASVYFHVLFQLPDNKEYSVIRKKIINKIKKIRKTVICDKNCIRKTKMALFSSYLGFRFTYILFKIIKKNDATF